MSSKKTTSVKKFAPKAKKAAPKAKAAKKEAVVQFAGSRHPRGRLVAAHGSKQALAKTLAKSLAREDEDTGLIAGRLGKASNMQLLRLQHVVDAVTEKYGSRDKLIAAIGTAQGKATDKDYLAKLDTFSLPQLLDLAASHERRTRA